MSKKKTIFSGACTALITPFRDGEIDYKALKNLIEFQIENGIDALLINGTTGENATLTEKEQCEVIAFAVREVGRKVQIIAGTGSNCTQKAIYLSKFASDVGADAILVVTPYYNKASDLGLIKHYEAIASAVDVPMILYNVPSRTGVSIPISVYDKLADNEKIVAVKEASPSVSEMAKLCEKCGDRLDIYSGNDDLILSTLSLGGAGVISVLSNILPKEVGDICRLWFEGKTDKARALQLRLLPLINAIFSEVNPIPIKTLLSKEGFCAEEYRLPLCSMNEDKKKALFKTWAEFKGNST